jgi:hypothetical protein
MGVPDELVAPVSCAPEREAQELGAAVEEVAVVLPGEADAAVKLQHLLGGQLQRVGGGHARARRGYGQLRLVAGERPGAVIRIGARQLDGAPQVRQPVLHRLERRHRPPEGVAVQGELLGDVEGALGGAHLLEGHQHGRAVQQRLGVLEALAGAAQQLGRRAVEHQVGLGPRTVEGLERVAGHAVGVQVRDHQRHALRPARGDHREVGALAVRDRDLGARQLAVLESALDGVGARRARLLGQGEGADLLAVGQAGQQRLLLGVVAEPQHGLGGQVDRGREGDGGQGAPDFLGDQAKLQVAEARAAVLLRDGGAQPAQLGGALPEVGGVGGRSLQNLARGREGRVLLQVVAHRLLEKLLVFGKIEVHSGGSPGLTRESTRDYS